VALGSALLLWGVAAHSLAIFTLGIFPAGAGFGAGSGVSIRAGAP